MSRPRLIALLLALVTLVVYLPVARDGFVVFDDGDYVTDNHDIQNGLTWSAIKWAFTTFYASNWHPVTWLSHMLDCQLFGLNPGAHHVVNALFHAGNAALLFILLLRLTGAMWPAAFIAALFAWHPLHVESVAWIAERKDVLSTFFALLTLLAYANFVRENCRRSFWIALVFFAFGLMAKPMLVTLPFVMVLLDYWPLRRFSGFQFSTIARSVLEKWPFLLAVVFSCVITFLAQSRHGVGPVVSLGQVSLNYRLKNIVVAYGIYLLKLFWPSKLAVFYPLRDKISPLAVATSLTTLVFISATAWRSRRQCPYFLVGWLWFLGTLVPVIGLVQVGGAAWADRYSYFPSIGIFIAVIFGAQNLKERFQIPKPAVTAAMVLILSDGIFATENQLRYWRDGETLFRHALAVTDDNDAVHTNLGVTLEEEGKLTDALAEYRAAERLAPSRFEIHNNLGNILDTLGDLNGSVAEYREAVRRAPERPFLHDSLGIVLVELGRFDEAMNEFTNATKLDPAYPWAHFQMAKALLKQGRDAEAIGQFREALRLDPENFRILAYIAHVLASIENPKVRDGNTALVLAIKANILTNGGQPLVLDALGMACAETGDFTNATEVTQKAFDLASAAKMKKIEPIRQRLELYKNHQPWRESFLATNNAAVIHP